MRKTQSSALDADKEVWVPRNMKCFGINVQVPLHQRGSVSQIYGILWAPVGTEDYEQMQGEGEYEDSLCDAQVLENELLLQQIFQKAVFVQLMF